MEKVDAPVVPGTSFKIFYYLFLFAGTIASLAWIDQALRHPGDLLSAPGSALWMVLDVSLTACGWIFPGLVANSKISAQTLRVVFGLLVATTFAKSLGLLAI